MGFPESLKLAVRRRAHFSCCLCHSLGVEVHHIVPEEDGGGDTEDNAAPLCPSCHETYGANPRKRKFIRETRDFWYELCGKRYAGDSDRLEEIAEIVKHAATKADLDRAVAKIAEIQEKPDSLPLFLNRLASLTPSDVFVAFNSSLQYLLGIFVDRETAERFSSETTELCGHLETLGYKVPVLLKNDPLGLLLYLVKEMYEFILETAAVEYSQGKLSKDDFKRIVDSARGLYASHVAAVNIYAQVKPDAAKLQEGS